MSAYAIKRTARTCYRFQAFLLTCMQEGSPKSLPSRKSPPTEDPWPLSLIEPPSACDQALQFFNVATTQSSIVESKTTVFSKDGVFRGSYFLSRASLGIAEFWRVFVAEHASLSKTILQNLPIFSPLLNCLRHLRAPW